MLPMWNTTAKSSPTDDLAMPAPAAACAAELIHGRRTVLPKRLVAPGPDAQQLEAILQVAAAAPDHGEILPWRFVIVPTGARAALAEAFEQSLTLRDAGATPLQREQAREKAFRAPLLLLAIARTLGEPAEVPASERLVSAGCAIQNMLLMAFALGFGSALTSGKALGAGPLRRLFALAPEEQALCFLSFGTPLHARPGRLRPAVARYCTTLEP